MDIEACTRHGVKAANAAGVNADAVAEHTFAMILGYYKNLPFLDTFMKQRRDEKLLYYNGAELKGRTIGIIGLGAIGRRVAAYCNAMGIHVLGYDPFVKECADYITLSSLEELLKTSDIITVHVYLNEETRHMFSRETFEKMKNTALLVNTARGGIVCQEDLIEALKTGQIGGACLDVFEEEPLQPRVRVAQVRHDAVPQAVQSDVAGGAVGVGVEVPVVAFVDVRRAVIV